MDGNSYPENSSISGQVTVSLYSDEVGSGHHQAPGTHHLTHLDSTCLRRDFAGRAKTLPLLQFQSVVYSCPYLELYGNISCIFFCK